MSLIHLDLFGFTQNSLKEVGIYSGVHFGKSVPIVPLRKKSIR